MGWHGMASVVMVVLATGSSSAQSQINISSTVETGWTSNATDGAAGGADFYASQSHELALTAQSDNFVLRGSLTLNQTRFLVTQFENDDEIAGGLEAQLALGESAVLRLGYAATQRWTGDDLSIAGVIVPVRIAETEHEYLVELLVKGAEQQVRTTLMVDQVLSGDSDVGIDGLPPLRLAADVKLVTGQVAWERALAPNLAVLAGLEAWFMLVPDLDQLAFLRLPADGGRVAAGLRVQEGGLTLEGQGGVDAVWPKGLASLLTRAAPYFALAARFVPIANVTLALETKTGVELAEPLDGVAVRTQSIALGVNWAPMTEVTVSAQLGALREWAVYGDQVQQQRSASLSAKYALSEDLALGATLSFARHENPGESYDKATVAVYVSGAL